MARIGGCGGGNYTLKLLQRFPNLNVTLVDLSQQMLDCAVTAVTDDQIPQGVGTSCYSTYSHALLLGLADPWAMTVKQIELADRLAQFSPRVGRDYGSALIQALQKSGNYSDAADFAARSAPAGRARAG